MIPCTIYKLFPVILPKYIEENIYKYFPNWDIVRIHLSDMDAFVKSNIPDGMTIDGFNELETMDIKKIFYLILFLYINGGIYMDIGCRVDDVDNILDSDIALIKTNENTLLPIFMMTVPKHPLLLKYLQQIYISKKSTTEWIENENVLTLSYHKIENHYSFQIKNKEQLISTRFITNIPEIDNMPKKQMKPATLTKIVITYQLKYGGDIFTNGFNQNVLFFYDLLWNMGYDVYFIISTEDTENINNKIMYGWKPYYKYITYENIFNIDPDIFFIFGVSIDPFFPRMLKYMGTHLIRYISGNTYMTYTEMMIYGKHTDRKSAILPQNESIFSRTALFTQNWIIPQNMEANSQLFQLLTRAPTIEAPFIWSPEIINQLMKTPLSTKIPLNLSYVNRGKIKKIGVFEPNMSVLKWIMIPFYITENAYRKLPERISGIVLTNTIKNNTNTFDIDYFKKFISNSNLQQDNKVTYIGRYQLLETMIIHNIDVVVSHQWGNPLNYLYLELAWMGWPVVHNAELCKDVGYYYNGYDIENGSNQLINAILSHDQNIQSYIKRNRKAISKYLTTNKELQDKYRILITNLYD